MCHLKGSAIANSVMLLLGLLSLASATEPFNSQVKDDEQLVVLYYNRAGQPIHVYEIQYHNPQMIILWGHDTQGNNYRIPVHMASVELNLMRVKIKRENQEERRIGFYIE